MNVFVLNTKDDIQNSIFFPTIEVNGGPKQPDYKLLEDE